VCRRDKKKYYDRGFEEINLALAAHVSKLTAADYKAVRPLFLYTRYGARRS
jgi:hypothetical protein